MHAYIHISMHMVEAVRVAAYIHNYNLKSEAW